MVVAVDERISIVKRELQEVKNQRSVQKAEHQNAILKLHEEHRLKLNELHQFMECLSRKKKQQQNDMKKYRQVISEVFADVYLPAFCVAKQAFLLRAVHTMMCFDQALFMLSQQCAEELKEYDRTIHTLQEETATISQILMSRLILVERHIHQCEQGLEESSNRFAVLSNLQLHRDANEEGLDDVPLDDDYSLQLDSDVSTRIVPKRHASSDHTLDTVDLSYVDTSSYDGGGGYHENSSTVVKQRSIPEFVSHHSHLE